MFLFCREETVVNVCGLPENNCFSSKRYLVNSTSCGPTWLCSCTCEANTEPFCFVNLQSLKVSDEILRRSKEIAVELFGEEQSWIGRGVESKVSVYPYGVGCFYFSESNVKNLILLSLVSLSANKSTTSESLFRA